MTTLSDAVRIARDGLPIGPRKESMSMIVASAAVMVGTGADRDTGRAIESSLPPDARLVNLIGRTTLKQLVGVVARCAAFVSNDSGAMHIAAAVGTPTVALHGPTNPHKWGPVGDNHVVIQSPIPCSPCLDLGFDYGCSTHPCMGMITVESVYEAIRLQLTEVGL